MKIKFILFAFLLIGMASGLTGCKKDPILTTGGLTVKVKLAGSTGFLTGVDVGLATSLQNLDNSIYLQDIQTDASGKADFGQLSPGNYYYDCFTIIGSDDYYGEGQVQIIAGQNTELTLTLQ
jgi:hypothetical protein